MSNFVGMYAVCSVITGFLLMLSHAINILPVWSISSFSIEIFLIASYAAFKQLSIETEALKLTGLALIASIGFACAPFLMSDAFADVDQQMQSYIVEMILGMSVITLIISPIFVVLELFNTPKRRLE